ncbi:NAD(P)H-dependent oxidoreductase subunit E [Clostridium fermenticellae]|uniref:NAD(P)H-dependent oxidoreductase subunit E n=1 Tax=Clostridium fermenticellae TaxID=2068654 RepID=A0A386H1G3_9CLOT|nr:NAD(P)H-dependent oxidoreductase subunit E [Clostridium fermenticellae]AYD39496.1 NAD(P)H-dependent oxidoreductase subunit E [Clostridium fermenticellae]
MCCNNVEKEYLNELDGFINNLEEKKGSLISVLHKAQNLFGYLSKDVQGFIANKLDMPVSEVNGVVTFYSYFTEEPNGKYVINVCLGTACFVKGSGEILEEFERRLNIKVGETTPDGIYTIQVLRCVGACGLAPVVTVNDKVYGHFTKKMVDKILDEYRE